MCQSWEGTPMKVYAVSALGALYCYKNIGIPFFDCEHGYTQRAVNLKPKAVGINITIKAWLYQCQY